MKRTLSVLMFSVLLWLSMPHQQVWAHMELEGALEAQLTLTDSGNVVCTGDLCNSLPLEDLHGFIGSFAVVPESALGPVEQWRSLVADYFAPDDVGRALNIIHCESRGVPTAVNPSSGASGLVQFMPGTWKTSAAGAGVGGSSVFDPEANIAAAAWLVYESDSRQEAWYHWNASKSCWSGMVEDNEGPVLGYSDLIGVTTEVRDKP